MKGMAILSSVAQKRSLKRGQDVRIFRVAWKNTSINLYDFVAGRLTCWPVTQVSWVRFLGRQKYLCRLHLFTRQSGCNLWSFVCVAMETGYRVSKVQGYECARCLLFIQLIILCCQSHEDREILLETLVSLLRVQTCCSA